MGNYTYLAKEWNLTKVEEGLLRKLPFEDLLEINSALLSNFKDQKTIQDYIKKESPMYEGSSFLQMVLEGRGQSAATLLERLTNLDFSLLYESRNH